MKLSNETISRQRMLSLGEYIITQKFNLIVFELYLTKDASRTRRSQLFPNQKHHNLQSKLYTNLLRSPCYLTTKSFTITWKYLYIMYWTQVSWGWCSKGWAYTLNYVTIMQYTHDYKFDHQHEKAKQIVYPTSDSKLYCTTSPKSISVR